MSEDEKTIVSAGADSIATFWEDSTEMAQAEKNDQLVKAVQRSVRSSQGWLRSWLIEVGHSEQDYTNYIVLKDYKRAIQLALAMSQPGRLLSLFTTVTSQSDGSLSNEVELVIQRLPGIDLARLLKHVRDWNANARTSSVAQTVLHCILKLKSPEEIMAAFEPPIPAVGEKVDGETETQSKGASKMAENDLNLRDLLDGLLPYSERHFARLDRLIQDSYVLDYVVGEMDGGLFGGELMDVDG